MEARSSIEGRTVAIRVVCFDEAGNLADADGNVSVTINFGENDFETVVTDSAVMEKTGVGIYQYHWYTTGAVGGTYRFYSTWTMDGGKGVALMRFRVLELL